MTDEITYVTGVTYVSGAGKAAWSANGDVLLAGTSTVTSYLTTDRWATHATGGEADFGGNISSILTCTDDSYQVTAVPTSPPKIAVTSDEWAGDATVSNLESNGATDVLVSGDGEIVLYYAVGLMRVARRDGPAGSTTYNTVANLDTSSGVGDIAWLSSNGRRIVTISSNAVTLRVYQVASIDDWSTSVTVINHSPSLNLLSSTGGIDTNADLTVVVFRGLDGGIFTLVGCVVGTTDDWASINTVKPAAPGGTFFGAGVAKNGEYVLIGGATDINVLESKDGWASNSLVGVINNTNFPELGGGFGTPPAMPANKDVYGEYVAIPSGSLVHVFEMPNDRPPPSPPTPPPGPSPTPSDLEELIEEGDVIISATDSIVGVPPGRDASFTAVAFGAQFGTQSSLNAGGRDLYVSTLKIGQPSPVIGSVGKDAAFTHIGAARLV